ncbi:hypothetical protein X907_0423 [Glycocaulis alkaliphilus]|uniref:Uncharacterized protein n=1 Tax=Glycocaulis alkaliphilus TaxID=1434191 RepID=A0A3T0E6G7_9PROT|nr:hypothetical protein [Glycocaulis alkaliphilus]AZU02971.1 hypothetical protein X907_0423 [Glycocaulis alkaliphilus]GGB69957.1 hypothetical protein GCM10007417_07190 [Glycocaulis alkaliphilus]
MFIGHYGPALAAPVLVRTVPLWALFFAVQFIDVVWGVLILAGIEQVRIVPGFTDVSPLDLHHMPYTHSLPGALALSALLGLAYWLIARKARLAGGLLVAAACFSHWLLDLIVHVPDLLLWPGGPMVGFGLWDNLELALGLEVALVIAGLVFYLRATRGKGIIGRIWPFVLVGVLLALEAIHLLGEPPASGEELAMTSLAVFLILTGLAAVADLTRESRA